MALGVGRVVPGLEPGVARWPFEAVGICFAIYGVGVIAYGSVRQVAIERALAVGRFPKPSRFAHAGLAVGGVVLGLLTALLVVID